MLTMQHYMLAKLAEQDEKPLSDTFVGGLLFPDAIRAYGVSRRVSHFELADDGSGRSSGWIIPNRMDAIEGPIGSEGSTLPDSLSYQDLAPVCPHAAFGQYTDVPRFCEAARAFDPTTEYGLEMLRGISVHLLAQDLVFDVYVREYLLDVTGMGSGLYLDRRSGRSLDAREARAYVTEVERQGIYYLAGALWAKRGITADTAWLRESMRHAMESVYPATLVEKTLAYVEVDPRHEALIQRHDFDGLDAGPCTAVSLTELYSQAMRTSRIAERVTGLDPSCFSEAKHAMRERFRTCDTQRCLERGRSL